MTSATLWHSFTTMRFDSLQDWLSWQESLNPKAIDLGLERVASVLQRLELSADFSCPVMTVAGTNGKGSTVAFIESLLISSGKRVGCYTSPHLFRYNERIRINQQMVSDEQLCEAFEQVDQARGDIPLTYFEFGTLAALVVFARKAPDVVVLEVGLGGRLDAVNVINPDVSVITPIDIDHIDWLGDNIEDIAREKAGIMRSGRPCVVGMVSPPASLLAHASAEQVPVIQLGKDYIYQRLATGKWQLRGALSFHELNPPALAGGFQLQNAATAMMAVNVIYPGLLTEAICQNALSAVELEGRYQQLAQQPEVRVDVAHNAQSSRALVELLAESGHQGKTLLVIAMLADKAVAEVVRNLAPEVDEWFIAGLDVPRGLEAKKLAEIVRDQQPDDTLATCETVTQACQQALQKATVNDRIMITGSFYTVSEASAFFRANSR